MQLGWAEGGVAPCNRQYLNTTRNLSFPIIILLAVFLIPRHLRLSLQYAKQYAEPIEGLKLAVFDMSSFMCLLKAMQVLRVFVRLAALLARWPTAE